MTPLAAFCLALCSTLPACASQVASAPSDLSEAVRKLRFPTAIYVLRDDGDSVAATGMADDDAAARFIAAASAGYCPTLMTGADLVIDGGHTAC